MPLIGKNGDIMVGYKFIPIGHEKPKWSSRETTKINSRLEEAFERWMEETEKYPFYYYEKAFRVLKDMGIKPSVEEVHSLLIKHQDEPCIEHAGYFLSAAYNLSDDEIIVYDLDLPLDEVGYKLDKNKVLINRGTVRNCFAWGSSGISINYGKCCNNFASCSSGISINQGKCGDFFAYNSSGISINYEKCYGLFGGISSGILVNCGYADDWMGHFAKGKIIALKNPKNFGYTADAKLLLKEGDCKKLPELRDYFNELKCRVESNDYDYLRNLSERMKNDLEMMLMGVRL